MKNATRVITFGAAALLTLGGASTASATSPAKPADVAPAVIEEETLDPGFSSEKHVFNGSSTHVDAFTAWFSGEEYVEHQATTRDLRDLTLPNGEVAQASD